MKKYLFFLLFLVTGIFAYSQTWTVYGDSDWDYEYTIITQEQFNRIVSAQETVAVAVRLDFIDTSERRQGRVVSGSRPNITGYFYRSLRYIPKSNAARNFISNTRAIIQYGNSRTGIMEIEFLSIIEQGSISLRFSQNEYIRQKNQLIRLVNGE